MEQNSPTIKDDPQLTQINERLNKLNQSLAQIQDTVLSLKSALETITREDLERTNCARVVATASKNLGTFLKDRNASCEIMDYCTKVVEQGATKVINTYIEKGSQSAIELIDYYFKSVFKENSGSKCADDLCFRNSINILKALRELIESSRNAHVQLSADLFSTAKWVGQKYAGEEDICNRLIPLANVTRLRILKILEKGGRNYAVLERETGIKAGHLRFHLNKLVVAGYVTQEKPQGRYLITRNGLKALQATIELCKIIF